MAGHAHHHPLPVGSKLKFGILLTSFILAVELVGGFLSKLNQACPLLKGDRYFKVAI